MDKNSRIAIIGAGPAGLGAGMYLEQKGYENYVIFEKTDHVGGKCHSPTFDGKRHEMGAIMGVSSYYAVQDVEAFTGVTHDGPKLQRVFRYPNGKIDHRFDKKLKNLPHLFKLKRQIKKFGKLLETKYKGYDICGHIGVSEGRYEGFAVSPGREPVSGVNPNLKDLALPFKEFCELNKVPLVQEVWIHPFTSFGYGYFDEIPAAYVLKYLDFQTMMNFMNNNLWTWKEGTQSIFEALNSKLKNPARLNSIITKIVRGEKVTITVNGEEEVFDKLIITAPLQVGKIDNPIAQGLDSYLDVTEKERELFSKIDYERYDTFAFNVEKEKYPEASFYVVDHMTPETLGHGMVFYMRWKNEPNQPLISYRLRKHKNRDETVEEYKQREELGYEETKAVCLEDIKKLGLTPLKDKDGNDKIVYEFQTYYFPHVFSEDYAKGWYEKVEALQGENNTYFAGEIMSFGDIDETLEYSRDLIERHFA
ncbi:FAD/NAD(P)-binding domain-containing protein [Anaeromyces robustus]|uniref:FAD/NAD(P)-binding domain-containing protein n=1 Tax=Anaeromyces robustus TaxID=1754192 RepID=A0A1Y1WUY6_9FUNG|nr:FAD/NAD(P)-binding domain-containing protein [Anaeromyces robustus]|eukprot:ORX76944.1 FAD/NAD(P)-binding domain-containing protein [Anaeromyces robustus]